MKLTGNFASASGPLPPIWQVVAPHPRRPLRYARAAALGPQNKGFVRMSLRFGFAEAPAVPAALEAHQAKFPVNIAETSSFLGRETPVGTVRPELPVWGERLDAFMARNAVKASDHFQIPPSASLGSVPRSSCSDQRAYPAAAWAV
jgi:K+ transporter